MKKEARGMKKEAVLFPRTLTWMMKMGKDGITSMTSILPQLEKNKGTISSALGKSLAKQVLDGQTPILEEAVALLSHGDKNVRSGAAKIVEQVAVGNPVLVAGWLPHLLPALEVPEPQTRWMAIHTLGLCAELDAATALRALPKAEAFIDGDSGACLWGATIVYLGHLGATSAASARAVFPLLERALLRIPRQAARVLQAFLRLLHQADGEMLARIARHAETHAESESPSVRTAARRVRKRLESP